MRKMAVKVNTLLFFVLFMTCDCDGGLLRLFRSKLPIYSPGIVLVLPKSPEPVSWYPYPPLINPSSSPQFGQQGCPSPLTIQSRMDSSSSQFSPNPVIPSVPGSIQLLPSPSNGQQLSPYLLETLLASETSAPPPRSKQRQEDVSIENSGKSRRRKHVVLFTTHDPPGSEN